MTHLPDASVPIPVSTLRSLAHLIEEGKAPTIRWSESREKMDTAASRRRTEIFAELDSELSPFIPE